MNSHTATRGGVSLLCLASLAHAASWSLQFDPSTASITSLSASLAPSVDVELVSAVSASNVLQSFVRRSNASSSASVVACNAVASTGMSWACALQLSIGGVEDACGHAASLNVSYQLAFAPSPLGDALLNQTVTMTPSTPGCPPASDFTLRLPMAATLAGIPASFPGAQRWISSYSSDGSPISYEVTAGDEPNGLLFVSAGTYELGPHKVTPAYPGYTLQVPAAEEYVQASNVSALASLRLSQQGDPYFLTSFTWGAFPWSNAFEWSYNCSDPNIACFAPPRASESRSLYTLVSTDGDASLDAYMVRMYGVALAHVEAPPSWIQQVALTNYDYFSPLPPSLNGFEADVAALAAALPEGVPPSTIAMCVHGWYGLVGQYTLTNLTTPALADAWDVFPSGASFTNPVTQQHLGPIPMTKAILHSRLAAARAAGFRVLLYFADSLNSYTGVPFATQQEQLSTYSGYEWNGPDTLGSGFVMNPLANSTVAQFLTYTSLLMDEYGADIDGLVWDETFMLGHDQPGDARAPGYAARAFMELIEAVRAVMKTHPACNECVLMVADCMREMPMSLVADGTYEDTGLTAAAAPVGMLRNYRGALWECGWPDISRGYNMRNATEEVFVSYNVPGGISNGWGDFVGFANMTQPEQAYFVSLLPRHNASMGPRPPAGPP